jgi:hypothetical protein
MKICNKCLLNKELSCFHKNTKAKDGLANSCKDCYKDYYNSWYESNKIKVRERTGEYYHNNKEEISKRDAVYREKNKQTIREKQNRYYALTKSRPRVLKTEEEKREKKRLWQVNKKKTDSKFKLYRNVRNLIGNTLNKNSHKKTSKTVEILGCSIEDFKKHLEDQFEPWMNWKNHGKFNGSFNHGWDLDHIIPIATAITEEDILKLNHFTNFKPLCSKVNRHVKRDKLFQNF